MAIHLYYDKKELDLANFTEFLFALLQFVSVMRIFMQFFGLIHAIIYYHKLAQSRRAQNAMKSFTCEH